MELGVSGNCLSYSGVRSELIPVDRRGGKRKKYGTCEISAKSWKDSFDALNGSIF
jgi:hypothetical protein